MSVLTEELKDKILTASEYIENGDPYKDVMDDIDVMQAIEILAHVIVDGYLSVEE